MPTSGLTSEAVALCKQTLAHKSKSFALAGRLLGDEVLDEVAVVYAYCRRADDAIDLVPQAEQALACETLRRELQSIYLGEAQTDTTLAAFQHVVQKRGIPRAYVQELLAGMEMDACETRYASMQDLLQYCFRVAGTVGLIMCHVLGVSDPAARKHAAHLGIAMQLTNICRDVLEDWQRQRLYLPIELLRAHGADVTTWGPELVPDQVRDPSAAVIRQLLNEADGYYASAARGFQALPWRAAWSIRTAGLVYGAIGQRLRSFDCDAFSGRAIVPTSHKLGLVVLASTQALAEFPRRVAMRFERAQIDDVIEFPGDVIPL